MLDTRIVSATEPTSDRHSCGPSSSRGTVTRPRQRNHLPQQHGSGGSSSPNDERQRLDSCFPAARCLPVDGLAANTTAPRSCASGREEQRPVAFVAVALPAAVRGAVAAAVCLRPTSKRGVVFTATVVCPSRATLTLEGDSCEVGCSTNGLPLDLRRRVREPRKLSCLGGCW